MPSTSAEPRDYFPVNMNFMERFGDAMQLMRNQELGSDIAPLNHNSEGCEETDWRGLPAQKLFRAAKHAATKNSSSKSKMDKACY